MLLLLVFSQLELAYLSNANVLKFSAQKIMSGSPVLVDFRGGESVNLKSFVPNGEGCRRVILLLNTI